MKCKQEVYRTEIVKIHTEKSKQYYLAIRNDKKGELETNPCHTTALSEVDIHQVPSGTEDCYVWQPVRTEQE